MTTYDGIVTSENWLCADCGKQAQEHAHCGITRRRPPFVGMMRIKNEERWIEQALQSIFPLCDYVFVLDDHSTDRTAEIVRQFEREKVRYFYSPFEGLNESRDKNWLYDRIIEFCEPQWIICIDGDEVLEQRGPQIIRETIEANPAAQSFKLKIAFMWGDPDHVRVDRIYNDFWRPSMFRPFIERPWVADDRKMLTEFRFMATPFGRHVNSDQPNLHCSSVPQRLIHGAKLCPVRLKHYGYMDREDRVRKLNYYTSIDWANSAEDSYRHMCQGDNVHLQELPAVAALLARGQLTDLQARHIVDSQPEQRLVHAGPLEVVAWNENAAWTPTQWAQDQCR